MNDEYLWDRSGPPDPEIQQLERTLAPLRYRHRPQLVEQERPRPRTWLAVAAGILLAAFATWQLQMPVSAPTAWQVASVEGAAQLGGRGAAVKMTVRTGQVIRTGHGSQIKLASDEMGWVGLGPDSAARASSNRRLSLERGLLHAFIWAPPRQFEVDTPSSRAIDLGCEYTIQVDGSGNGLLRVLYGWVAFQFRNQESFIPEGAACSTRRGEGPGIPYFEDAPETLRQAVSAFERGDKGALASILAPARAEDGLTLWHLLTRVSGADRSAVFDRFAQLVELPDEVTREGVLRTEPRMIDACWDALKLENTDWWRYWERKWK
jgi:hypothetical protein